MRWKSYGLRFNERYTTFNFGCSGKMVADKHCMAMVLLCGRALIFYFQRGQIVSNASKSARKQESLRFNNRFFANLCCCRIHPSYFDVIDLGPPGVDLSEAGT